MLKVALLSRWHVHADDYARGAKENPDISIELIWDEETKRGEDWAKELNVHFEADLDKVLTNPDIDAVIISTPTNLHKDIIIAAAKNKKHIFTEKVLAFTVKDCEEIYQAVEESNVELMLSLPRLTENYYLYAQDALDSGKLGRLTSIRCRLAHNGGVGKNGAKTGWLPERFFDKEQAGGGALMDLGAHPIYLTNRLAGPAKAVQAQLQQSKEFAVDDNSAVLVEYESGAIGVIESGFISYGSPFQLELYGTEGVLLIEENNVRIQSSHLAENGWQTPELPDALPMPMQQWTAAILHGAAPSIKKEDVLGLTAVNEKAAQSQVEGKKVNI